MPKTSPGSISDSLPRGVLILRLTYLDFSAIAWVYKNIPDFGGDLERFFLTGHSAGAHLVSLIALDSQYVNAVGVPITFIKGVASISGIYTLSHPMDGGFNGWTNWAYRKVCILFFDNNVAELAYFRDPP
jgi:hypothetical protein